MFNKSVFAFAMLLASLSAQASVQTFTDRAAFQAAVSGYTVDNLNDITDGAFSVKNRGQYTINVNSFGCSSGPSQCGENLAQGFSYPAYVWTYNAGTFVFKDAINAFGLDFGAYANQTGFVTLNGQQYSSAHGGFFGVLDTSSTFTSVSYAAGGSGSLLDNVTYGLAGRSPQVPEPGSMALFAIALAAAGFLRRRSA